MIEYDIAFHDEEGHVLGKYHVAADTPSAALKTALDYLKTYSRGMYECVHVVNMCKVSAVPHGVGHADLIVKG